MSISTFSSIIPYTGHLQNPRNTPEEMGKQLRATEAFTVEKSPPGMGICFLSKSEASYKEIWGYGAPASQLWGLWGNKVTRLMDSYNQGYLSINAGNFKKNYIYKPASLISKQYRSSPAACACWENVEKVDLFFKNQFSQSIVQPGRPIKVILNSPNVIDNAFWCPGDDSVSFDHNSFHFGNYNIFNPMEYDFSIMAHEMTHAVVTMQGGLGPYHQAGSLNESISDVFSVMAQHYYAGVDADSPDTKWLIGEGIYRNKKQNNYLRSLKDPEVGHMNAYDHQPADEDHDGGGIHSNCGITSKAFYLAAQRTGGKSYEKIGKIWHQTLAIPQWSSNGEFEDFASKTMYVCKYLRHEREEVLNILGQAWMEVGITPQMFRTYEQAILRAKVQKNIKEDLLRLAAVILTSGVVL